MLRPLRKILDRIVTTGSLDLVDASGCVHHFGDGNGVPVVARIADTRTEWRLLLHPALALGEA